MTERMASADVAFLHRETRTAPQHVGGLAVFTAPPAGFDYERLVRLLEERISLAPRYRQKVRMVPGHLANPMWVDDPAFDITYHVRRSALPRPGTDAQLLEFCARIESRLLDRSRPLWEMYLVEGLADGRVAIITKTHEAMVGEFDGIDLTQVILDAAPAPRRTVEAIWMPCPEPSTLGLLRGAAVEIARRPIGLVDTARGALRDVEATVGRVTSLAGGLVSVGRELLHRRPAGSALNVELSEQRRLAIARTQLADYRQVRDAFGGTVNDAMLAVVAGALRGWLLARAHPLGAATTVRALVPVSVTDDETDRKGESDAYAPARLGPVRPLLVDLPVGEPDPVLRLAQLRYAMASHRASGRAVGADVLAELSGFAPPTLHALGARAAGGLTRRMFSLVVTNVPGPQWPLYAAGARMTEMFPIVPLSEGQAVSIALSSYDGGVYYGINGDRDAMPDVDLLAGLIEESLAELVTASEGPGDNRAWAGLRPEPT
jgi:diacylglycerol O-acyltransferase